MEKKVEPTEDPDLELDLKEIGVHAVSPATQKKRKDRVYCCWVWGISNHLKDNPGWHHHLCKAGMKAREKWLEAKNNDNPQS